MNEPRTISFNRQVGQSVYLFWLVEPSDLGAIMGFTGLNMFVLESYGLFFWTVILYAVYILAFRAGRPRGYDRHFFSSLAAAKVLRPGRSDSKAYIREKDSS